MTIPGPQLLRRVARIAIDVHSAGLTRRFSIDEPIALRLPTEDVIWYAALYGPPDEGEGIHLAKGPLGLRYLRDLADQRRPDRDCERAVELLDVAYVPLHALAPAKRGALQKAGVLIASGNVAPDISVKGRNRSRSPADSHDLRRLEMVLLAVLSLAHEPDFEAQTGALPTVVIDPASKIPITVTAEQHADDLGRTTAPMRCSDASAAWPIVDARWVLGIGIRPPTRSDMEARRTLFILDADDGRTLALSGGGRGETVSLAREFLRGLWIDDREPGFATEMIVLDDELRDYIADTLGVRGVTVTLAASHPVMDAAQTRLGQRIRGFVADDDLETWRALAAALDSEVGRRFEAAADPVTVFRAFFGPWRPDIEDDADSAVLQSALTTMVEWAAFSWRRNARSPTVVEQILRGDLDARSRAFLTAHAQARQSLYVVRSTRPEAQTLDIEDVFTGERTTAHDRSLSRSASPNLVVPLRVVPIGPFRMLWMAGPSFTASEIPEALSEIERCGVEPTRECIAARPEILGRLWPWRWERRKHPVIPKTTNADGDDLVFHEAVYALTDGQAAREALAARADLEYVADDDYFSWRRPTRQGEEAWGDAVLLGRLRFIGDELIAEVNSKQRFRVLRAWLDEVPGVAFRRTKTANLDALKARVRPRDDHLPDAEPFVAPPAARAMIAERLDAHWRTWTDIALPMLGGSTPREACTTPSGRAKVAAFIRTLTSPSPTYDIEPVRVRLLKELGLDSPPRE